PRAWRLVAVGGLDGRHPADHGRQELGPRGGGCIPQHGAGGRATPVPGERGKRVPASLSGTCEWRRLEGETGRPRGSGRAGPRSGRAGPPPGAGRRTRSADARAPHPPIPVRPAVDGGATAALAVESLARGALPVVDPGRDARAPAAAQGCGTSAGASSITAWSYPSHFTAGLVGAKSPAGFVFQSQTCRS